MGLGTQNHTFLWFRSLVLTLFSIFAEVNMVGKKKFHREKVWKGEEVSEVRSFTVPLTNGTILHILNTF